MVRTALVVMRSRTFSPSVSLISETFCRFGRKRRLVLLCAWLTLLPVCTPLPVMMHRFDMTPVLKKIKRRRGEAASRSGALI